jgi:hypothetical protein
MCFQKRKNQQIFNWFRFFRFPIGKGIAGHVALTGETLNVADVYKDDRFNPAIDEEVTPSREFRLFCACALYYM